ncbi:hypothetical protein ACMFMG_010293 [Clarireedia jacksonii]
MKSITEYIDNLNLKVAKSTFGRVFHLDGSGHERQRKNAKFVTEIRAGLTTFFTMAYIIAVNVSQSSSKLRFHLLTALPVNSSIPKRRHMYL